MERKEAIQYIRENWETILRNITTPARQNVNGRQSFVCPICGHGAHGDGLTINPKSRKHGALKCFGSCDFSGDDIDLLQQVNGYDFNAALQEAAGILGIEIDSPADDFNDDRAGAAQRDLGGKTNKTPAGAEKTPQAAAGEAAGGEIQDYTAYYATCRRNLYNPAAVSYLQGRGISTGTAERFGLGYDPEWISPTAVKNLRAKGNDWTPPATARIILPVTKNHYVARAISPDVTKYQKQNETGGGEAGIFNAQAMYYGEPEAVFVVEGVFDALAISEAGAAAVALNSTSNAGKLIKQLEQEPTPATVVICLDNDDAGKRATATLRDGLNRLNIGFITADINCGHKDPNDALCADRPAFVEAIRTAERQTAARPDSVDFYIDSLMGDDIARFKSDIKTGFPELDRVTGGLYPGLYTVGAISSLGKTTFCAQLADQIAEQGADVLFFSMEQSRLEMVSKSLARITAQHDLENFVTSLSIRRGYLPQKVKDAAKEYKTRTGGRMNVIEGNFNCNISFIGDYIRRYIRRNRCRPVVFIDYLQILQPTDDGRHRQNAKDTIDIAVTELKRISREFEITVFVISSVNRANYLLPIDFSSFKESGAIEFTSDVVWGLQLQCLSEPLFSEANKITEKRARVLQAKAATPRKVELVCLKNRYGVSSYCCGFNYYPAADLFCEDSGRDFITRDRLQEAIENHRQEQQRPQLVL